MLASLLSSLSLGLFLLATQDCSAGSPAPAPAGAAGVAAAAGAITRRRSVAASNTEATEAPALAPPQNVRVVIARDVASTPSGVFLGPELGNGVIRWSQAYQAFGTHTQDGVANKEEVQESGFHAGSHQVVASGTVHPLLEGNLWFRTGTILQYPRYSGVVSEANKFLESNSRNANTVLAALQKGERVLQAHALWTYRGILPEKKNWSGTFGWWSWPTIRGFMSARDLFSRWITEVPRGLFKDELTFFVAMVDSQYESRIYPSAEDGKGQKMGSSLVAISQFAGEVGRLEVLSINPYVPAGRRVRTPIVHYSAVGDLNSAPQYRPSGDYEEGWWSGNNEAWDKYFTMMYRVYLHEVNRNVVGTGTIRGTIAGTVRT